MAIRCKTVEYVFPQFVTSLASTTRNDFAAITLTLPETGARTFLSVEIDVMCVSNVAAGVALTSKLMGIKLGAVAFDDQTVANTLPNTTASQVAYHFSRNVTSYFNTNFGSGATQTCQVGVSYTGPATTDHTVKLIITYSYDDAGQDTRVKTVRIPLDSSTTGLTAVLAEIGTNQVPILNTTLPESTKTFKQIWFEIVGANCGISTTNSAMGFALDAAAEFATSTAVHTPGTSNFCRHFFDQSSMDTSVVHAFKMRTTSTNYPYTCASIVLCVTYTYSHASSTRILNHVAMTMGEGQVRPGSSSAKPTRYSATIAIAESGALTLRQSGVVCYIGDNSLTNVNVRAGAQNFRQYAFNSLGNTDAGGTLFSHRVDAGGSQGVGVTLASGALQTTFDVYGSAVGEADWGQGVSPVLYLNYESDKHATLGDGAHNHTTLWASKDGVASINLADGAWTPTPPNIPETSYYASDFTFQPFMHLDGAYGGLLFQMEVLSGETNGPSWVVTHVVTSGWFDFATILEDLPVNVNRFFRQYPTAGTLPNIGSTRIWRSWSTVNGGPLCGARIWITHHSVIYNLKGAITGYTGSGAGITVDIYNNDTKVYAGTTQTTPGGNYSIDVYDGANYFAVAASDSTHCGRSATAVGI